MQEDHAQRAVQHGKTQVGVVWWKTRRYGGVEGRLYSNCQRRRYSNDKSRYRRAHLLVVFSEAMYFHSLLELCLGALGGWLEGDRLPEELQLICLWVLSRGGFFCKSTVQLDTHSQQRHTVPPVAHTHPTPIVSPTRTQSPFSQHPHCPMKAGVLKLRSLPKVLRKTNHHNKPP